MYEKTLGLPILAIVEHGLINFGHHSTIKLINEGGLTVRHFFKSQTCKFE